MSICWDKCAFAVTMSECHPEPNLKKSLTTWKSGLSRCETLNLKARFVLLTCEANRTTVYSKSLHVTPLLEQVTYHLFNLIKYETYFSKAPDYDIAC